MRSRVDDLSVRQTLLRQAMNEVRPVAVIDANLLRDKLVVREKQARYRSHGEQIVIADAVWNESVANDNWQSTVRASFRHLADDPEALVASWAVVAMISAELKSGVPAVGVVHHPMTAFLRQLVVDLAREVPDTMGRLRRAIEEHGVNDKHSMAVQRKEAMERLVELTKQNIPRERFTSATNAMRCADRGPFLDLIVESFRPSMVSDALVRQGVAAEVAESLTSRPSVTVMQNLYVTHMALEWTASHGVTNAKLGRVHNDYVDGEYGLVAWACGGEYVTADNRARRRFEEVRDLCERIWT
jgi:hypothetical protein